MMRAVVLRPEPGASATAERMRERGIDPIVLPLFDIQRLSWVAPEPSRFDAILITSANAVRMGGEQLKLFRHLPVHAVGRSTADAARHAGFKIATIGNAGIDLLLDSLGADLQLLHLCGEDRHPPQSARQEITPLVVYRAKELSDIDIRPAEGSAVLIHSRRAACRFAQLVDQAGCDRASISIGAISRATASLVGKGWARVEIADQSNDEALLALTARLCNKPDPQ